MKRLALVALAGLASAQEVVHITELSIFSLLPLCVSDAFDWNYGYLTASESCGSEPTALQSCICSESETLREFADGVSTSVASSCGQSASEDQESASAVIEKYCTPSAVVSFATPTDNLVEVYITDLPEMTYLAPCAASAVSEAVMGYPYALCPEDASLYAPCVCSKTNVVSIVSSVLSSSVQYSCSNTEDLTSAEQFYSEYCDMNKGTTTFARPDGPPGDMSYYITALTQFESLEECAQSGVSEAVMGQTDFYCASAGPQALASCACINEGKSYAVSSSLTSLVKALCDSTATDALSSAGDVFEYYCSAAENQVVATVAQSITSDYPTPSTGSGSGGGAAQETGANGGNSESSGEGSSSDDGGSGGFGQAATIAVAVLGSIVGLALIAGLIWFMRRRSKKHAAANTSVPVADPGKPELAGADKPDPGMEFFKAGGSPSITTARASTTSPGPGARTQELQGTVSSGYSMPYGEPPQELGGQGYHPPLNQGMQEAPTPMSTSSVSPISPNQRGPHPAAMGWQSEPVQYELSSEGPRR